MDTVTPVDNIDTIVESTQSEGLLGYIQEQQFSPATGDMGVNPIAEAAGNQGADGYNQDVATSAVGQYQPDGVTNQPVGAEPVDNSRYERAIADLQAQVGTSRQQVLQIAAEARRREDAAFEASLSTMDESDAELARLRRESERMKGAAEYYRRELEQKTQSEQQRETSAAKNLAAYKLAQHLGLSVDSVPVLLTAETTTGMLGMAKALAGTNHQATAYNPVLTAAGGNAPTAAPQKKAPQRTGDLLSLFAERPYVNVATN